MFGVEEASPLTLLDLEDVSCGHKISCFLNKLIVALFYDMDFLLCKENVKYTVCSWPNTHTDT